MHILYIFLCTAGHESGKVMPRLCSVKVVFRWKKGDNKQNGSTPCNLTHTHTRTRVQENIFTHGVRGQSHVNNHSWLVWHYSSIFYFLQIRNLRRLCLCVLHLLTGHKCFMSHIYSQYRSRCMCVSAFQLRGHWFLRHSHPVRMYGHTGVYAFKCEVKYMHTEWNPAILPITHQILSVL